jgi:hypothetical protein
MKNKMIALSLGALLVLGQSPAFAANVEGFRSAKFGGSEKDVIQAAIRDLHITEKDIQKQQDPTAKVTILSAKLNSFEPVGVPATVNYVMGYKCNCLTQVSIQWNYPKEITPAQRGNAMLGISALANRFQNEGWGKDEMIVNRLSGQSKDGSEGAVVFFHGQNPQGGAITLLGGPVKITKDKDKPENVNADVDSMQVVSVIYEKDAKNPDVNKIDVSGF